MKISKVDDYEYGYSGGEFYSHYKGDYLEVETETPPMEYVFTEENPFSLEKVEEVVEKFLDELYQTDELEIDEEPKDIAKEIWDSYQETDDIITKKASIFIDDAKYVYRICFSIDERDEKVKANFYIDND